MVSYAINNSFRLMEFLWMYNGRSNVSAFIYTNVGLYFIIIILTLIRSIIEEDNGWAIAVFILNMCTVLMVTADAKFWSFTNAVSLFFVITAESLCLAANILVRKHLVPALYNITSHPSPKICFTGNRNMRATSVMVLFLVFLQKGSFLAYIGSTILRAIHRLSVNYKTLITNTANDNDNDSNIILEHK